MICVSESELEIVLDILRKYAPDCEARVFGSRYKWTPKEYSDLDIALVGKEKMGFRFLGDIRDAFEESDLPYRVDVLDWFALTPEFQAIIEQGYEVIYSPQKNGDNAWPRVRLGDVVRTNASLYSEKENWQSVKYLDTGGISENKIEQILAATLSCLDDKIELNNRINANLEAQAQAIFKSWFVDFEPWGGIIPDDWWECPLSNIVQSIDNRGKTPPFASHPTDYPIIDVKALAGEQRIIDYSSCTKYVEEETYNTWFRSGHPQPYDILLSTVGSLAEMKLFLGNRGCIAQNVVGFRTEKMLSLYLFQYLQFIKDNLVLYNIGSVQPSIKVTHIIKHPIVVPKNDILTQFNEILDPITNEMYKLHYQNEYLAAIRDALLPRLMSGEIEIKEALP